jgi:hypothetical protein
VPAATPTRPTTSTATCYPGADSALSTCPGGTAGTRSHAINASADIAGGSGNRTGGHGFLLHDGTYTTIDIP